MKINSEKELLEFGEKFAKTIRPPLVIELIGDVGAGKTTFVRGFAKGLGIKDPVTSPSFTISKSYAFKLEPSLSGVLTHYDFYRLKDPGLMSEDLEESLNNPNTITIVEWADSVENLLPKNRKQIFLNYNDDGSRNLEIKESK